MIIIHAMDGLTPQPRLLRPVLDRALRASPVVAITGARQTGKSTLAHELEPARRYITLDDIDVLARAHEEPDALLREGGRLTIDEVQRAPDLMLSIKRAVDRDRTKGRFLLTGSANLLLLQKISESLAGRATYLTLMPMTSRELRGEGRAGAWTELFDAPDGHWPDLLEARGAVAEDWRSSARRGGYPEPALTLSSPDERSAWFAGYVQTYLERDLRELSSVASLVDFRRLMRAACLRIGNLVNQSELARDVGMPQPSVHRHLNLLEISYQLVRLPPYAVNRTKRLIKSPKLYWTDTGLAMHLAGETEPRGAHLENLVLVDLLAWAGAHVDGPQILYWRASTGEEVDFVVEWRNRLLPIEVKATKKPRLDDIRSLRVFRDEYGKSCRPALLLHAGSEITWLADDVLAAPWWKVL